MLLTAINLSCFNETDVVGSCKHVDSDRDKLGTCLLCHSLPVQPEDDNDVEAGLYDDTNK